MLRQAGLAQRIERDQLGARGGKGIEGVGVGEREGPARRHPDPERRPPRRSRHLRGAERRSRGGDRDDGVEVDASDHRVGEPVESGANRPWLLGDRNQPEMAIPPGEAIVPSQDAEHRNAALLEGVSQQRLVGVRSDPVQHHPGHADGGVEGPVPVDEGGHRSGEGPAIDHEDHRSAKYAGDVRGRRGGPVSGPVEETHDAFDDEQVGARRGPGGQWRHRVGPAQPRIEVSRWPSARQGVVPGIDEIGADLGRGRAMAPPAQGGQQPGGHGCLAHTRVGAGNHQPGAEGGGRHRRHGSGRRPCGLLCSGRQMAVINIRCPSWPRPLRRRRA